MKKSVRILWIVFFVGVFGCTSLILLANWGAFGKMPSIEELENPSLSVGSEIFASDGTLMGKYYLEDRSEVKYKDISPHVIHALIATEDERFYEHSGIDGRSLGRAIGKLGKDGGGSTITQQLAKNLFTKVSSNTAIRVLQKLKEWIIAVKLERRFSKEEIITMYLNTVAFGDDIYGIRNAANTFFQKEPIHLTVDEAAVLVGMLKGNTIYNPRRNLKAATDRRNTVIDQMVRNQFLTEAEATAFQNKTIKLKYKKLDQNTGIAPYFREIVRDQIKKWCKEHKKPNGEPYDLYRDGLKIYTTINTKMQVYAEEAVAKHMPQMQKILNSQSNIQTGSVWSKHQHTLEAAMKSTDRWKSMQEDSIPEEQIRKSFYTKVHMKIFAWNAKREKDTVMTPFDSVKYCKQMLQSGFMVMDPVSGEIKAWVGGDDFKSFKYDHININTKRQVGSSIKPMLYALSIEEAGFTPQTPLVNAAQFFPGYGLVPAKGGGNGASVPMAYAIAKSLNGCAAYLMKQIGARRFVDFLKSCDLQTDIHPYPSIALGSCEISLYEMLWMYSMFPGQGFNVKPILINRIEDRNGNIIENFSTKPARKEVISEATAYTMCRMMQGCVDFGTGSSMRSYGIRAEMGAKTGTTNDNTDAWFIGYTPQLLAGSWVGCDNSFIKIQSSYDGQGGRAALPIWVYFFKKVFADKTLGISEKAKFVKPKTFKKDSIMYDYLNTGGGYMHRGGGREIEGQDNIGNGGADDYATPATNDEHTEYIPPESTLTPDEDKIRKDAQANNYTVPNEQPAEKKTEKKQKGFFKRLFGGKEEKKE